MVGFGEDFLACTHATVMEGSPGDDTWQREAVGTAGGAGAPWVRAYLGVSSPRLPSTWRLYVGPGPLSMWVLGPNLQVSGPSLYLLVLDLCYAFTSCAF
jgi:hypothetical protein